MCLSHLVCFQIFPKCFCFQHNWDIMMSWYAHKRPLESKKYMTKTLYRLKLFRNIWKQTKWDKNIHLLHIILQFVKNPFHLLKITFHHVLKNKIVFRTKMLLGVMGSPRYNHSRVFIENSSRRILQNKMNI